nr:immunoglobulin light chain [Squalus acanthias]
MMFCLHSTNADPVLTQPPSISTSPGKTVKITCTISEGSIGYYTSWYWQKPGSAPVLVWYGRSRPSGIPDRFTGSADSSRMHLTITNVQSEDAADYYCSAYRSSPCRIFFGRGTKLNLGNPRPPSVSVLPPSSDQIAAKNTATLVCLVNGFNPGAVAIEWTVDGSVRGNGVETSRVQQETDNTFSVSSYLTLPASEWNSHELYTCVVKHETQATPLKTSIARSSCM